MKAIAKKLYPFDSKFMDLGGLRLHYVDEGSGEVVVADEVGRERERYKLPYGAVLHVHDGDSVSGGQMVANWDPHTHPVITEVAGTLRFVDFVEGVTVQKQIDDVTGLSSVVVLDPKQRPASGKDQRPMVKLIDDKGNDINIVGTTLPAHYFLPGGAIVGVSDGASVGVGDVLALISGYLTNVTLIGHLMGSRDLILIDELAHNLQPETPQHWRVRLRYHPATTPWQQTSRWLTMPWNGWSEQDLRTGTAFYGTRVYLPVVHHEPMGD